jgi:hypothetical protein
MSTEVLLLIIATSALIGFLDVNFFCLELLQKAAVVRSVFVTRALFVFNFQRICIEILLRLFCDLLPRVRYRAFHSFVRRFYYH